jgi:hypothetical protein
MNHTYLHPERLGHKTKLPVVIGEIIDYKYVLTNNC